MNTKVILAVLAVAAGAGAFLWWRPAPPNPVAAPPSENVQTSARVGAESPPPAPEQPDRSSPRLPPTPPAAIVGSDSLLAAIEQALASTNVETRDFALTNLLPTLVLADPLAAGRLAETNALPEGRDVLLQQVAKLLAAQDPAIALAWASGLPAGDEREAALNDVCLQIAESNPAGAIAQRQSLLAEHQSYDALEDLAQKWAEQDMTAAQAWIAGQPADVRRDQLIGRVAYVLAQTAPQEAAQWVVETMTPGDPQIEAAVSVLHQWGKQDLAAATAWAEQFPEGPLRERALKELAAIAAAQNHGDEL
jgi:hypothetical protein